MESLRKTRKNLGIRQQDLKSICGISQESLSRIESGRVIPKQNIRQRIEAQFGPVDWLSTSGYPKHKTRAKKLKPAVIEQRLIRLFLSIHLLDRKERNSLIWQILEYILSYVQHDEEDDKMFSTQMDLLIKRMETFKN